MVTEETWPVLLVTGGVIYVVVIAESFVGTKA